WPRLAPSAPRTLPAQREQAVRLLVLESLRLAEEKILPVARRLLEKDLDRIAEYLRDNPDDQRAADEACRTGDGEKVKEIVGKASGHESEPGKPEPRVELRIIALGLMEQWLQDYNRNHRGSPIADPDTHCEGDDPSWTPG